jgi:hypothetical protein
LPACNPHPGPSPTLGEGEIAFSALSPGPRIALKAAKV